MEDIDEYLDNLFALDSGIKICRYCGKTSIEAKIYGDIYESSKITNGKVYKYWINAQICLDCNKAKGWDKKDPTYYERNKHIVSENTKKLNLSYYGFTHGTLLELHKLQEHRCAVCGVEYQLIHLVLDHCHRTGTVRALLCRGCNLGIGHFDDKPELIQKALNYLIASYPAQTIVPGAKFTAPPSKMPGYKKKLKNDTELGLRNKKPSMVDSHAHLKKIKPKGPPRKYYGFEICFNKPGKPSPWRVRNRKLGIYRYYVTHEEAERGREQLIKELGLRS